MTKSRSTLAATAVLATVLVALSGCGGAAAPAPTGAAALQVDPALRALLPAEVRAAGVLTVANDPSYPPVSSFAADGRTIVGFEPDLGAAVGRLLGVQVRFQAADFDSMLAGLQAHRFDLVMSAMTDTPDREQQADFVTYFRAGSSIVVPRGNPRGIRDLDDLCGQAVAVQTGTVQVGILQRGGARCGTAPVDVRTTATNDDALLQLRTGQVAAVLSDYPPAVFVTTDPRTQASSQLVSDTQYEPGLYGVAVARDRTGTRDALVGALQRLVGDGVYRQVLARWHVDRGAVDAVTVDGRPAGAHA